MPRGIERLDGNLGPCDGRLVFAPRMTAAPLARSGVDPLRRGPPLIGPTATRDPVSILALQRAVGNRAVVRALGRSPARTLARAIDATHTERDAGPPSP